MRLPAQRRIVGALALALVFGMASGGPSAALAKPPAKPPSGPPATEATSGCRPVSYEGASFSVCRFALRSYDVRLFLQDQAGQPYGSLPNLLRSPAGAGLVMAMNAGMYHHDLMPVGLYVEEGRERTRINTAPGPGNFHLKPNGVFFVADGRAGILETQAFLKRRPRATLATQSGPMLVIDGRIHPRFSDEGPSRKIRNGVGVGDAATVTFAISDEPVSFGTFARLFRDGLGCRNALFLDGSVSALHAVDLRRTDVSFRPLGPMIGVLPRRSGP